VIGKSGARFSEEIMLNPKELERDVIAL